MLECLSRRTVIKNYIKNKTNPQVLCNINVLIVFPLSSRWDSYTYHTGKGYTEFLCIVVVKVICGPHFFRDI